MGLERHSSGYPRSSPDPGNDHKVWWSKVARARNPLGRYRVGRRRSYTLSALSRERNDNQQVFQDRLARARLLTNFQTFIRVIGLGSKTSLLREILSQFSEGQEIETAGDSFFIVFAKPRMR
jgi:hypothetical protein